MQNFKIFEILNLTILKILNVFLSKNHLAFLSIERYDTELTNIKISDKNMVPLAGARAPEGVSFFTTILKFSWFRCKMLSQQKIFKFKNL